MCLICEYPYLCAILPKNISVHKIDFNLPQNIYYVQKFIFNCILFIFIYLNSIGQNIHSHQHDSDIERTNNKIYQQVKQVQNEGITFGSIALSKQYQTVKSPIPHVEEWIEISDFKNQLSQIDCRKKFKFNIAITQI
jgi:hypothetical protein